MGLTNAAGTLVERYTYSAYGTLGIPAANGTVRSSSTYANRYTYTGREWDAELKLYHFRARWYDPSTGGFISRDPLGYVDGMSMFRSYKGLRYADPTGTRNTDLTCTCKRDYFGVYTVDVKVACPCPSDEAKCCKAACDSYQGLYGWNGSWRGALCTTNWRTKEGCIQGCYDQCAYDNPSWYHYHNYVACVNACLPGCNGEDFNFCSYMKHSMTQADIDRIYCLCGLVDVLDLFASPNPLVTGADCFCGWLTSTMNNCSTPSKQNQWGYSVLSSLDCGVDVAGLAFHHRYLDYIDYIDYMIQVLEEAGAYFDIDNETTLESCFKAGRELACFSGRATGMIR